MKKSFTAGQEIWVDAEISGQPRRKAVFLKWDKHKANAKVLIVNEILWFGTEEVHEEPNIPNDTQRRNGEISEEEISAHNDENYDYLAMFRISDQYECPLWIKSLKSIPALKTFLKDCGDEDNPVTDIRIYKLVNRYESLDQ